MKKLIILILSVFVIALSGCSSSSKSDAEKTLDSYFNYVEDGKVDKAYELLTDNVFINFNNTRVKAQSDYINLIRNNGLKFTGHKIVRMEKVSDQKYYFTVETNLSNKGKDEKSSDPITMEKINGKWLITSLSPIK